MKIGILTFHRSQNYGALLQAKGLQEYLRLQGNDVSFVDYWPKYHTEMYKPFVWSHFRNRNILRKIWYVVKSICTYHRLRKRQQRTAQYIHRFLNITSDRRFDIVVYGSDQIWRKLHTASFQGFNPVYWGEGYVEAKRKIAFAASMGKIEIDTDHDKDFVRSHLKYFSAVSIRELELSDRLKRDFGLDYPNVCDPVFLLSKEQWQAHTNRKYLPPRKYIFYYRLQELSETDRMVKRLVRETNYDVIEMRSYMPLFHYGKRYRLTADAQEFLTLISGAEYVVSSSFHGIALSIVFGKQFFATLNMSKAGRVRSLLEKLELLERFENMSSANIDLQSPINYNEVNPKLESFITASKAWLNEQLRYD